ncbi:MAG: alpha/beta hydrolase [Clostridia bacterium]|nr:alpha/beta hydrolase [Clostridia bacterium]
MIIQTIRPGVEGLSMQDVTLTVYLQESSEALAIQDRPLILVCPGGGYAYTSDREAEPLALSFLAMGYHAAVLRYSVAPVRFPAALCELVRSMKCLRDHAAEWKIRPDRIFVLGCSAGGHLVASLGALGHSEEILSAAGLPRKDADCVRPNGLILCYPVITGGEFAHRGSFDNLLGPEQAHRVEELSLEKRDLSGMPPVFIWHTFQDQSVPVENTLLFARALRAAGIETEMHVFARGEHGLSLSNELTRNSEGGGTEPSCTVWTQLVHTWLSERCGY